MDNLYLMLSLVKPLSKKAQRKMRGRVASLTSTGASLHERPCGSCGPSIAIWVPPHAPER